MALLLNIDTSTERASVSLAKNGVLLSFVLNNTQKEHASFLHTAIRNVLQNTKTAFSQLDAVAVTEGPGSYTGLRVGMASAKGLSYALGNPFITLCTLEAMAFASLSDTDDAATLYCPMIDARRMEIYTALYKKNMEELMPPQAVVLNEDFLKHALDKNKIVFSGSGIQKWKRLINAASAVYIDEQAIYQSIAQLTYKKFTEGRFTELAHSQPLYVKEFYSGN